METCLTVSLQQNLADTILDHINFPLSIDLIKQSKKKAVAKIAESGLLDETQTKAMITKLLSEKIKEPIYSPFSLGTFIANTKKNKLYPPKTKINKNLTERDNLINYLAVTSNDLKLRTMLDGCGLPIGHVLPRNLPSDIEQYMYEQRIKSILIEKELVDAYRLEYRFRFGIFAEFATYFNNYIQGNKQENQISKEIQDYIEYLADKIGFDKIKIGDQNYLDSFFANTPDCTPSEYLIKLNENGLIQKILQTPKITDTLQGKAIIPNIILETTRHQMTLKENVEVEKEVLSLYEEKSLWKKIKQIVNKIVEVVKDVVDEVIFTVGKLVSSILGKVEFEVKYLTIHAPKAPQIFIENPLKIRNFDFKVDISIDVIFTKVPLPYNIVLKGLNMEGLAIDALINEKDGFLYTKPELKNLDIKFTLLGFNFSFDITKILNKMTREIQILKLPNFTFNIPNITQKPFVLSRIEVPQSTKGVQANIFIS